VREFTAQLIRLALCSREPLAGDRNATVVFCSSDAAVITHGSRIPPQSRWPETRTFRGVADRPEEDWELKAVFWGLLREGKR